MLHNISYIYAQQKNSMFDLRCQNIYNNFDFLKTTDKKEGAGDCFSSPPRSGLGLLEKLMTCQRSIRNLTIPTLLGHCWTMKTSPKQPTTFSGYDRLEGFREGWEIWTHPPSHCVLQPIAGVYLMDLKKSRWISLFTYSFCTGYTKRCQELRLASELPVC